MYELCHCVVGVVASRGNDNDAGRAGRLGRGPFLAGTAINHLWKWVNLHNATAVMHDSQGLLRLNSTIKVRLLFSHFCMVGRRCTIIEFLR